MTVLNMIIVERVISEYNLLDLLVIVGQALWVLVDKHGPAASHC